MTAAQIWTKKDNIDIVANTFGLNFYSLNVLFFFLLILLQSTLLTSDTNTCTYINKCIRSEPFNYWFLSDLLNQPLAQHAVVYLHISFPYQSNAVRDTYSWIIHLRCIYIRCRAEPQPELSTGEEVTLGRGLCCVGWRLHPAFCLLAPPC